MSYTKKAVFGALFSFAAFSFGTIFAYLTRLVLSRHLSVTEFGLFYAVMNFVVFLMFFRDMGLGHSLAKFIPEQIVKKKFGDIKSSMAAVLAVQFITTGILCIVLFGFSNLLTEKYFNHPSAKILLYIFLIYAALSVFVKFFAGALRGFKKFYMASLFEPLTNILVFIFIILFIFLGMRSEGAALSYVSAAFVLTIIGTVSLFKTYNLFNYKMESFRKNLRLILIFGFPMLFAVMGGRIISYIDTLMLTYFTDLNSVAVYNVILPSAMLFLFFGKGLAFIIIPLISELYAKNDQKRISDGIRLLYKYAFVGAVPMVLTIFAFPDFFITFFFSKEYTALGVLPFQILLIGTLFFMIEQINSGVIVGIGDTKIITKITLAAAFLNVILNLILIPIIGILGAAIATSSSYILMLIGSFYYLGKLIKIDVPYTKMGLSFLSGIICVGVIWAIKYFMDYNVWIELIGSVSVAGILYLLLIFLLKIIDVEEIKFYAKLIMKQKKSDKAVDEF